MSPGYVVTEMTSHPPPGKGAAWVKKWMDDTPVSRFASPDEIGRFIALMCSEEATTFMTGHDLVVDGGELREKVSLTGRIHIVLVVLLCAISS